MLKSKNNDLIKKLNFIKSKVDTSTSIENQRNKNDNLKRNIKELTSDLTMFTKGKKNLEKMIGKKRVGLSKNGVEYDSSMSSTTRLKFVRATHKKPRRKYYPKGSYQNHRNVHAHKTCNYYGKKGHITHIRYTRKAYELGSTQRVKKT